MYLCVSSNISSLLQVLYWVCCCFMVSFRPDLHFVPCQGIQLSAKQDYGLNQEH